MGLCPPVPLSPGLGGLIGPGGLWSPEMSYIWVTAALVPQAQASPRLTAGSDLLVPIHEGSLALLFS